MREKKVASLKIVFEDGSDYSAAFEVGLDKDKVVKYIERAFKPSGPLIKDEKVRKAVKAWANADLIKKAYLEDDYTICANDDVNVRISFSLPVFKDVGGAYDYTIAELCGEEDE